MWGVESSSRIWGLGAVAGPAPLRSAVAAGGAALRPPCRRKLVDVVEERL
jgi:hypothetical protein